MKNENLIPFLVEFSSLTDASQRVFIYCLRHLPNPVSRCGDIQHIAQATGVHFQTVHRALKSINQSKTLSTAVQYISINKRKAYIYEQQQRFNEQQQQH